MKRLLSIFIAIVTIAQPVAAVSPGFLPVAAGFGQATPLVARASGAAALATETLLRVGGVLFAGELDDSSLFEGVNSVSLRREGDLAVLSFLDQGVTQFEYRTPAWLLGPVVRYALDSATGAVSFFGSPTKSEREQAGLTAREFDRFVDEFYFVEVHEALIGTGIGLRLMQSDSIPIADRSYLDRISVIGREAVFPGEDPDEISSARSIVALSAMRNILAQCQESSGRAIQSWLLTDVDTVFTHDVVDGQLSIYGTPYYFFWNTVSNEALGIPECIDAVKRNHKLLSAGAPLTWAAVVEVVHLSALMRSLLSTAPGVAHEVGALAATDDFTLEFPTPRVWPKLGYQDYLPR